jgi:hypothetical protein
LRQPRREGEASHHGAGFCRLSSRPGMKCRGSLLRRHVVLPILLYESDTRGAAVVPLALHVGPFAVGQRAFVNGINQLLAKIAPRLAGDLLPDSDLHLEYLQRGVLGRSGETLPASNTSTGGVPLPACCFDLHAGGGFRFMRKATSGRRPASPLLAAAAAPAAARLRRRGSVRTSPDSGRERRRRGSWPGRRR